MVAPLQLWEKKTGKKSFTSKVYQCWKRKWKAGSGILCNSYFTSIVWKEWVSAEAWWFNIGKREELHNKFKIYITRHGYGYGYEHGCKSHQVIKLLWHNTLAYKFEKNRNERTKNETTLIPCYLDRKKVPYGFSSCK